MEIIYSGIWFIDCHVYCFVLFLFVFVMYVSASALQPPRKMTVNRMSCDLRVLITHTAVHQTRYDGGILSM